MHVNFTRAPVVPTGDIIPAGKPARTGAEIFVKTFDDITITMEMILCDTVDDIKSKFQASEGELLAGSPSLGIGYMM